MPETQAWPFMQRTPQPPQFSRSEDRSVHTPMHCRCAPEHCALGVSITTASIAGESSGGSGLA
jgi:hypothetical protein